MTDPIADMLNRLRNAQAAKREAVEIPFSQVTYAIAKILEKTGFVKSADFKGRRSKKTIEIALNYGDGIFQGRGVKRISKPGQRVYASFQKMPRTKGEQRIAIVSTSKGIMTNEEARKEKVGGEVLCEIWA